MGTSGELVNSQIPWSASHFDSLQSIQAFDSCSHVRLLLSTMLVIKMTNALVDICQTCPENYDQNLSFETELA